MSTFVLSLGPIYFVLCEASPSQATLGKLLLNIYVTDDDGTRISVARATRRWIAKFVLGWFLVGFVSIFTIATRNDRKALHDCYAQTRVPRGRPQPGDGSAIEPWRIAVGLGLPFVWMLGTFLSTL
jgi:uncharacterized RDD family membrane protein YckC